VTATTEDTRHLYHPSIYNTVVLTQLKLVITMEHTRLECFDRITGNAPS